MRISPVLLRTAFLFVAAFAQAQQTTGSANTNRSTPIAYQGRAGTIFSNGEHTYLFLDGETKSWEIVPVRQNDSSRFTLQANAAIYITLTDGQIKIIDTSDVTKTASLASPESAVTPIASPQTVPDHAVIASGYVIYNGGTEVSKTRFTLERTDETQDGARVYRVTMSESENAATILKITAKDDASPREFFRKLPPSQSNPNYLQVAYHLLDVFGNRRDGPFLSIGSPGYQSFANRLMSATPYHQPKYPVHADKDSYNRFFYHISISEEQQPVSVIPRLDPKVYNLGHKSPLSVFMPNTWPSMIAGIDFTSTESKNGDRQRDWMFVDQQGAITYFQLSPEYKLKKGQDGPWTIKVSATPLPLHDPKHPEE